MKGWLAIKALLVFCAAIAVGRLAFTPDASPAPKTSEAKAITAAAPIPQPVSSPAPAPAAPVSETPKAPPKPDIDQSFRAVDGGVKNENARLTHFLASVNTEGSIHTAPHQFGASMQWRPFAQELLRADEVVSRTEVNSVAAVLEGVSRVTYPGTFADTDERMHIRPDGGIEHDIVLKRAPAIDDSYALAYSGYLRLGPGLSLWDGKNPITTSCTTRNGIHIKNQFGNTVFHLRRPFAYDSSVTNPDGTLDKAKASTEENRGTATACKYRVDFDDAGIKLAVVTPGQWLADPARAYPVTIDPNTGPFGLKDGDPAIYTGAAGNDTLIPANAGGQAVPIIEVCATKPDNGWGIVTLPFSFEYYGTVHPIGTDLYVHIDGFASWQDPRNRSCNDTDNQAIPTSGYPDDAFFCYWDDLRFSTQPGAGIYFFVDGTAPSRRLVIEWFKMGYSRGNSTDAISFNLVLFECENKIEIIIGQANETDNGLASVGIEDQTGLVGIQYDFNSATGGAAGGNNNNVFGFGGFGFGNPFFNNPFFGGFGGLNNPFFGQQGVPPPTQGGAGGNTGQGPQPISPGTSLSFQRSALGFLVVGFTQLTGCLPHTVCYDSEITVAASTCSGGQSIPSTFGFHWTFADNAEGFTPDICHTWVRPGTFLVNLDIIDEFGTTSALQFDVRVCDVPDVVVIANPQGGTIPLEVELEARAMAPTVRLSGAANWVVDRLGNNTEPGQFASIAGLTGDQLKVRFDSPGIYRLTASFAGVDTASGLPTAGVGTVYIFAASPTDVIEDSLLITESQFVIDWVGKRDGFDPDGLPPDVGSTTPGLGLADDPERDTLFLRGYISLPGVPESALLGRRIRVVLNGVEAVFDGILDANGTSKTADREKGQSGQFDVNLPSGLFSCYVKRNLFMKFGVADATERRLLPAHYRLEIEGLFPPPGAPGAIITYDYDSKAFNAGPPPSGSGRGVYRFGAFTRDGAVSGAPAGFGKPGGQTILLSGGFMVTDAKLKLEGNTVFADLKGKLARYGGDDLRPQDTSDVVVAIGGYSEALNFTTTTGFKTSGRPPAQRFTFKRAKALGKSGIQALVWQNQAGNFRVKTYGIPNELVGLNPSLGVQTLVLGLTITPENNQVYNGIARFEVTKKSITEFVRLPK